MDKINVGIIGFGTVGSGVAKILLDNAEVISARLGADIVLKSVADTDTTTDRGVKLADGVLVNDAALVLDDPDIHIVVELVGGTGIAKDFTLKAIANGKHVATANKALLSTHGEEIFKAASKAGLSVGFEASVGGGIPVLKALKDGLSANRIDSIYGIINGTANFILDKMTNEGGEFADVLKEAQELGYAEADPTYDIEGIDTAHKLALLIDIAYGTYISLDDIYCEGISSITPVDIKFAKEFGYRLKLLAISKKSPDSDEVEARVHPTMVPTTHPLASVEGVFNAVFLHGDAVGSTMYYGKGAGQMATASAVVADIVDIARELKSGVTDSDRTPLGCTADAIREVKIKDMAELECAYYIRFSAIDRPGVLSTISGVLGDHNISISSVIQKHREAEKVVPLVIVTHAATEKELRAAITEIDALDVIKNKSVVIRIEENFGGTD